MAVVVLVSCLIGVGPFEARVQRLEYHPHTPQLQGSQHIALGRDVVNEEHRVSLQVTHLLLERQPLHVCSRQVLQVRKTEVVRYQQLLV